MSERECEMAERVVLQSCGGSDYLHLVMLDEDGEAIADAALGLDQARELAQRIMAMLYQLSVLED